MVSLPYLPGHLQTPLADASRLFFAFCSPRRPSRSHFARVVVEPRLPLSFLKHVSSSLYWNLQYKIRMHSTHSFRLPSCSSPSFSLLSIFPVLVLVVSCSFSCVAPTSFSLICTCISRYLSYYSLLLLYDSFDLGKTILRCEKKTLERENTA